MPTHGGLIIPSFLDNLIITFGTSVLTQTQDDQFSVEAMMEMSGLSLYWIWGSLKTYAKHLIMPLFSKYFVVLDFTRQVYFQKFPEVSSRVVMCKSLKCFKGQFKVIL